jgi:transposase
VILMDNAPYHHGRNFAERMRQLQVPLIYLGPYQFKMAPVELCFSFIKKHDLNLDDIKVGTV